ncbi:hypothetical protein JKF63_02503 [Porcisia hertigi]|uniref:Kynurenine formamidase n=1 Tax=Porcisia hertigi TaxID=2761500 RepID=A0A836I136_9TRYP|nr:hypothetical protein JKF63_02503 [Porcisia hertigi]
MMANFTDSSEADRKVLKWKWEAKQCAPVSLAGGIDLTMSLEQMQVAVPPLSSFHVLYSGDILTKLVHIPSITVTAMGSAFFGALVTLLITSQRSGISVLKQGPLRRWELRVLRLVAICVAAVMLLRFLRARYPVVVRVSQYENLSSCPDSPCFVANRILTMTSSHAGTHADGPHHFSRSLSHRNYDDAHYTGDAVVLDVTAELRDSHQAPRLGSPLEITAKVLEKARAKLPAPFRDGSRPVWRLLLITRDAGQTGATSASTTEALAKPSRGPLTLDLAPPAGEAVAAVSGSAEETGSSLQKSFAFLCPDAVHYLYRAFPSLLLVGIDSPSVDPTPAVPLANHSHIGLLEGGIAILENLSYTRLFPFLESPTGGDRQGWVAGSMLTVFNVTQNYDDARGCSVVFFPEQAV